MDSDQQSSHSHLFTVRLWVKELGGGQREYRGTVQHVVSREACHFRDWAALEAFLLEKLKELEQQQT